MPRLSVLTMRGDIIEVRSVTLSYDGTEVKGWPGGNELFVGSAEDCAEVMGMFEEALENGERYVDVLGASVPSFCLTEQGRATLAEGVL